MKNIINLLFLLGMIFSCKTENSSQEIKDVNNTSTLLAQNLMELWETGDTLRTQNIFLDNCEYVDIANNYTFSGIEGVNKYVGHVHKWASEVNMEIRKINVSQNMGYVEWTMSAKHTSPIEGRVPIATNRDISINGATLIEFKDGKIAKASDYLDALGFVIQLGSRVELPGGVIILSVQESLAQNPTVNNTKAEQEIINLSKEKWQWMSDLKVDTLAALFHEKAVFVHMGGNMTKDQELNVIKTGRIHYKKADIHEASVNFIGDTAILLNRITLLAVVGGNEVTNPFSVTEVYLMQNGTWKLASMSFTKLLIR